MLDQAQDLRQLANRHAPPEMPSGGRPALVVVLGGKGGVGSTTIGLNLAEVLTQSGMKTVLIDADPRGGDVALMCGIEERSSIVDLLEAQLPWEEIVQIGPNGVKLVTGHRAWHEGNGSPAASANRLLARLEDPNLQADLAVIDAGNSLDGPVPHLCRMADAVLLVTTTDAASVVNTFAAIKALVSSSHNIRKRENHAFSGADIPVCLSCVTSDGKQECLPHYSHNKQPDCPIYLLVNMAPSAQAAEIVHYRLARACRRLLGIALPLAGHLERDCPDFRVNENGTVPFVARLEKIDSVTGNDPCRPIRLNLPSTATDTLRRLLAADVLLKWRRHAEFNGLIQRRSAK